MVSCVLLTATACAPLMYLNAPTKDTHGEYVIADSQLERFEQGFEAGIYPVHDDGYGYPVAANAKPYSDAEKPTVYRAKKTCMHANKIWPNLNVVADNDQDGFARALDERYGVLYQHGGVHKFWYEYNNTIYRAWSKRFYVVGDGTQIFEVFQTLQTPVSGCNLVGWSTGVARLEQYFRLYSAQGKPSLERLRQPMANKDAYLKAVEFVDAKKRGMERSLSKDRSYNAEYQAARSAQIARDNERRRAQGAEHYTKTYNRVMGEMASMAQSNAETHSRYRRDANRVYNDRKYASGGGSYTRTQQSRDQREEARRREKVQQELAYAAASKKSVAKHGTMDKSAAESSGVKYTHVSIEAHGTTDMHFPYEQALDLAETNAHNAAANSCADQGGRLEKGSGTLSKKNCAENAYGEHRCDAYMLFTCVKR